MKAFGCYEVKVVPGDVVSTTKDSGCIDYRDVREWKDVDGQLHRIGGPAVERADGGKEWWRDGKLHREDGPAIEYANGLKEWWENGRRHRVDGPALESPNGYREWWVEGKFLKILPIGHWH